MSEVLRGSRRNPTEERGLALADANTEGRKAVLPSAPAKLMQKRDDEPRARHAKRMA